VPCLDGQEPDADGDGHNKISCGGDDCDDGDSNSYPGNAEVCDVAHTDEDCEPDTFGTRDADGDGFIDAACCNERNLGGGMTELVCGDDCNDFNSTANINSPEVCNGIDDDCNGLIDDEVNVVQYIDSDSDGYGAGVGFAQCPGTPGFSLLGNDCDDANVSIKPGVMFCDEQDPNTIKMCLSDGTIGSANCVDECVSQPNHTGFCQQKKVKKVK